MTNAIEASEDRQLVRYQCETCGQERENFLTKSCRRQCLDCQQAESRRRDGCPTCLQSDRADAWWRSLADEARRRGGEDLAVVVELAELEHDETDGWGLRLCGVRVDRGASLCDLFDAVAAKASGMGDSGHWWESANALSDFVLWVVENTEGELDARLDAARYAASKPWKHTAEFVRMAWEEA